MKNTNCCADYGKLLGVFLMEDVKFEKGMSISSHLEKRAEKAKELLSDVKSNLENGKIIVIK